MARKLPEHYTRPAREKVIFYETHRDALESVPVEDQRWVAKLIKEKWWDNGQALEDKRFTGSARSVYNFITQPDKHWDLIPTNNVVYVGNGNYRYYASRTS